MVYIVSHCPARATYQDRQTTKQTPETLNVLIIENEAMHVSIHNARTYLKHLIYMRVWWFDYAWPTGLWGWDLRASAYAPLRADDTFLFLPSDQDVALSDSSPAPSQPGCCHAPALMIMD